MMYSDITTSEPRGLSPRPSRRLSPYVSRREDKPHGSLFLILTALLMVFSGCGWPEKIDTTYGRRRGGESGKSVNGTAVLAQLFKAAGHRVITWRSLSPELDNCDTIVWTPDDFAPPTVEQRDFLENWLWSDDTSRTLVYIGRDYDAEITYWKNVTADAPAAQVPELSRRLAHARANHHTARSRMPGEEDCRWFTMRGKAARQSPRKLDGPWTSGRSIDGTKSQIVLEGRLDILKQTEEESELEYEVLLRADGHPLVTRVTNSYQEYGQIIVVVNGSFLLNLPLVNHEHRKLAGRLIQQCGQPGQVVFLESGPGGPDIGDGSELPTGLEALTVWPLNLILLHAAALGIVYCLVRLPIFGKPRDLDPEDSSDFGKHVDALGELLELTRDRDYATAQLAEYYRRSREDVRAKVISKW